MLDEAAGIDSPLGHITDIDWDLFPTPEPQQVARVVVRILRGLAAVTEAFADGNVGVTVTR